MNQCQPKLLFESNFFNITQCTKCQRIGLYYRNILVGFQLRSFLNWGNSLLGIPFEQHARTFPCGDDYFVLNSCHPDIQFTFSRLEFKAIKEGIVQALLLLEAQALVQTNFLD